LVDKKIDTEESKKYINYEELREDVHELDGFNNFKERFLGVDGMFSNFKILIGKFASFGGDFHETAGAELKKKGF
jgi:hypothetical protein